MNASEASELRNKIENLEKQNRKLFAQNGEYKERLKNLESCMVDVLDIMVNHEKLGVGDPDIITGLQFMRDTVQRYNPQRKLPL